MFTRQFRKLLFLLIFIVWTWKSLSHVRLFATPRTVQSMEFSRPRILEWVAFPFSMGSSQPRDWTQFSCIAGRFFTSWVTREPHKDTPIIMSNKSSVQFSHSVVSSSLRPHGLHSPWSSPGQNTGVGNLSLLQWIFPAQESNWGLLHCRQILYKLSYWKDL